MTISTSTSRSGPYLGAGSTGPFTIGFRFLADSHLKVIRTTVATQVEVVLTLNVDYTVTGAGDPGGGTLMLTSALSSSYTLTIQRDVPITQETDYVASDPFPAEAHEDALDKLTMIAQQQQDAINRTLRVPETGVVVPEVPDIGTRAGRLFAWDSNGNPAVGAAPSGTASAVLLDLINTANVALGDKLVGTKRTVSNAAATTVHDWIDRHQLDTYADFNIAPDGSTNQTAALTALLSALGSASFRGWLRIPYNTKFDVATVYAAVPTGLILDDESSINWGQPPGYKNKFRVMYSGDTAADDTQKVIASGHHPALMLLNMGTAGSAAAADRYASILHGVGKDSDGDPILGWLFQFAEEAGNNIWRASLRLQTPFAVATANPQPWVTATVYAAGAYCTSDGGKVYKTTAGGTSGGVAPTGTGTGINDGGVLWDYVQAALNIDSTRFDWNEHGRSGQYAPANGIARHTQQAGGKSWYFELDDATGTITFRDATRGLDILSVSTAAGLRLGIAQGPNWLSISGTGPNAPVTGFGKVANGGATNMSTMVPPSGRAQMTITLRFDDANTTLVHGTGTNNLRLKGGVNTTPAAGSFITLAYDSSDTASWREVARSY